MADPKTTTTPSLSKKPAAPAADAAPATPAAAVPDSKASEASAEGLTSRTDESAMALAKVRALALPDAPVVNPKLPKPGQLMLRPKRGHTIFDPVQKLYFPAGELTPTDATGWIKAQIREGILVAE